MNSSSLNWALHYATRGWSLIPVAAGTKRAKGKWASYQTTRADEAQLRQWFGNGSGDNIAVVLGFVSAGLVCRDFDKMDSYNRWAAAHPDLAKTLPTVATARGRHVYFRAPPADLVFANLRDIDPPEEGEYRGDSGHYCLLPPSVHPDGPTYRWLIPPPDGDIPLVGDVRGAGLLPAHVTESATNKASILLPTTLSVSVSSGSLVQGDKDSLVQGDDSSDIERAIRETLPTVAGNRNRQVLELARALKAIVRLADAPADELKPYVRQWHDRGRERGVIGTEPFDETWANFVYTWPVVRFPRGTEPLAAALARATDSPAPAVAIVCKALDYEDEPKRLLVALCYELHRASAPHPFFLSCHSAARLLGLDPQRDHVKTLRWLKMLVTDRVLEVAQAGVPGGRRATRYRWIAEGEAP